MFHNIHCLLTLKYQLSYITFITDIKQTVKILNIDNITSKFNKKNIAKINCV